MKVSDRSECASMSFSKMRLTESEMCISCFNMCSSALQLTRGRSVIVLKSTQYVSC
jgi:hypothetical protein